MEKSAKIFVAGHRGLVGSALCRALRAKGYDNILTRSRIELDLTDAQAVASFFRDQHPEYVFLAAARVGGIHANNTYPAEFIWQNLVIQTNVIHEAWRTNVKRLLFLGSSCIYPRDCPQPIREEYFLTGPLEPTNRPYAVAKIAGVEMCWSYNRQYGTSFLGVMPTNLFGVGDNYHPLDSHVIPALLRRFHEAKKRGDQDVVVWGTGRPRREFMFCDDMADACVFLMELPEDRFVKLLGRDQNDGIAPIVNIGVGKDMSIAELASEVAKVVGFSGQVLFDASRPDGTPRKILDVSRLHELGWCHRTSFQDGLRLAYEDFLSRHERGQVEVS